MKRSTPFLIPFKQYDHEKTHPIDREQLVSPLQSTMTVCYSSCSSYQHYDLDCYCCYSSCISSTSWCWLILLWSSCRSSTYWCWLLLLWSSCISSTSWCWLLLLWSSCRSYQHYDLDCYCCYSSCSSYQYLDADCYCYDHPADHQHHDHCHHCFCFDHHCCCHRFDCRHIDHHKYVLPETGWNLLS